MSVDHAAKNRRMCQHRKSAVANTALTKDAPGRRRGANLPENGQISRDEELEWYSRVRYTEPFMGECLHSLQGQLSNVAGIAYGLVLTDIGDMGSTFWYTILQQRSLPSRALETRPS